MSGLRIALVACRYPGGLLDRTPQPRRRPAGPFFQARPGPADAAARRLRDWVQGDPRTPAALVHCGDRIYIDATAGLFDPAAAAAPSAGTSPLDASLRLADALDAAYAATRDDPYRVALFRALVEAIDDHEIVDNWEPSLDPQRDAAARERRWYGLAARDRDRRARGRPIGQPWGPRSLLGRECFVADTRTERSVREPARLGEARLLGDAQWRALRHWLEPTPGEEAGRWRVLVAPPLLLPRRLSTTEGAAFRADGWDGYPRSQHDLLAAIAEQPGLRCLVLGGDEHLAVALRAQVQRADAEPGTGAELVCVHTGAMYAPYPFANARPEDFADEPAFEFDSDVSGLTRRYRCTPGPAWFPAPGRDGFVAIDWPEGGAPAVAFHAASGGVVHWGG